MDSLSKKAVQQNNLLNTIDVYKTTRYNDSDGSQRFSVRGFMLQANLFLEGEIIMDTAK